MKEKSIRIKLENGLEARPIAMLVQLASKYDSSIYLEVEGNKKVNAKSIMGMMSLSLHNGEKVIVSCNGDDEDAALADIENFLGGEESSN